MKQVKFIQETAESVTKEFETGINEALKNGWELSGNLVVTPLRLLTTDDPYYNSPPYQLYVQRLEKEI